MDWNSHNGSRLGIRSSRSGQISECERFAQVAQDKWATVSESLRSLMTNEGMWAIRSGCSGQMSELLGFLSKSLMFSFAHKKWTIRSKKFEKIVFWYVFTFFGSFFLKMLIPSERSERIAQVAQDKWATVSDLLRSLRRNELSWANRSDRSPNISELLTFWENRSFTHFFLPKNKRFAPKFDDWIPYPVMVIHDSPFL